MQIANYIVLVYNSNSEFPFLVQPVNHDPRSAIEQDGGSSYHVLQDGGLPVFTMLSFVMATPLSFSFHNHESTISETNKPMIFMRHVWRQTILRHSTDNGRHGEGRFGRGGWLSALK